MTFFKWLFFCFSFVSCAYSTSVVKSRQLDLPWSGAHNRHEGQICSDDSDCVLPLICFKPPSISSPENAVANALAPRLTGALHAGVHSLLQGKMCRRVDGPAAKLITEQQQQRLENKQAEALARSSGNLFQDSLIESFINKQVEEMIAPKIICKNLQRQRPIGTSLFVDVSGTSNDLFETTSIDSSVIAIYETRQHRKVADSFSFLCDREGSFTVSFKILLMIEIEKSQTCLMRIDCVDTPSSITDYPTEKNYHQITTTTTTTQPTEIILECLNFKASIGVNRSISIPLENSVYRVTPHKQIPLLKHFIDLRVSMEKNVTNTSKQPPVINQIGSGPVLMQRCENVGPLRMLVSVIIGGEVQICPLFIGDNIYKKSILDCYLNDPPTIDCDDPPALIVGSTESVLNASNFYKVTDIDDDIQHVELKDAETKEIIEEVNHDCGPKAHIFMRKIEITAIDTYHTTNASCEIIFGTS